MPNARIISAVGAAAALAVAVPLATRDGGERADAYTVELSGRQMYQPFIDVAKRAHRHGDHTAEVLSPEVEPGDQTAQRVRFPLGHVYKDVELVGPANGAFRIDSLTYSSAGNGVYLEVKATNTGHETRRLSALVEYEAAP